VVVPKFRRLQCAEDCYWEMQRFQLVSSGPITVDDPDGAVCDPLIPSTKLTKQGVMLEGGFGNEPKRAQHHLFVGLLWNTKSKGQRARFANFEHASCISSFGTFLLMAIKNS
jgi:hypothetical protein